MRKQQLLAIVIAAGVSGCSMTPEQRANFINGMNAINMGFRPVQQYPMPVMSFQRPYQYQPPTFRPYQPPQQMNCTTNSIGATTYTNCR